MENKWKIKENSILVLNSSCEYFSSNILNFIMIFFVLLFFNISHYECSIDMTLTECRNEFWNANRLHKIIIFMVISNLCLFSIIYRIVNKRDFLFFIILIGFLAFYIIDDVKYSQEFKAFTKYFYSCIMLALLILLLFCYFYYIAAISKFYFVNLLILGTLSTIVIISVFNPKYIEIFVNYVTQTGAALLPK